MSTDFIFRLGGMIAFAILGVEVARSLQIAPNPTSVQLSVIMSLLFALLGVIIAPWITLKPFNWVRAEIRRMPATRLVSAIVGLVIGLTISALLAAPLAKLPTSFSQILPFIASLIFGYLGLAVMAMRHQDIMNLANLMLKQSDNRIALAATTNQGENFIVLDTSVIIDGRIADISQTGFLRGTLLVPRFVLAEVQHISDSSYSLRRNRGRRGLEILDQLQQESIVPLRFSDRDFANVRNVDDKLMMLAKQMQCPILTTDYNLNRVAKLQGIPVLNINDLANAVKNTYLPGEIINIRIIQEGSEQGQGVGYLADGTMVVVQGGKRYLNHSIEVDVTKVLQTAAGRMIFAQLGRT